MTTFNKVASRTVSMPFENKFMQKTVSPLSHIMIGLSLVFLTMTGCDTQQTPQEEPLVEVDNQTEPEDTLVISSEAAADIDNFEAEFINKMVNLQQSQLAEYEALQAADAPDSVIDSTSNDEISDNTQSDNLEINSNTNTKNKNIENSNVSENKTNLESENEEVKTVTLQDLPLATNVVIKEPDILSEGEISGRYRTALQSLYLPGDIPLPTRVVDTLLNIATLTPDVFSNEELAYRLTVKAPALSRLLKQYQTWEYKLIQQSTELESIKQEQLDAQKKQTEEFEAIAKEFEKKIADYDKQIENYEKMLKKLDTSE